jgi:hypothetical protein
LEEWSHERPQPHRPCTLIGLREQGERIVRIREAKEAWKGPDGILFGVGTLEIWDIHKALRE